MRPLGAVRPLKTCIFRGLGAQKTILSYSFDRIVLIFGYIVERTNTKIVSSHFFAISISNPNYDVINDVIMSDADCTPGREPRSVAASLTTSVCFRKINTHADS